MLLRAASRAGGQTVSAPALSAIEATLARLVAYPTVSSEPTAAMAAHLAERLEDAGARVRLSGDAGTGKLNLVASLGPDLPRGGILLSGHMDVVPVDGQGWSRDPFALAEADGRLHARGSCDMKGFIAACIELAATLRGAELARPLHFAFTHDEEVGCLGAQALLPELHAHGPRPDLVIVGEPTGMAVIEGHKGCHEYTVRLGGRAGHGSRPETGVNAAEYAARYVVELLRLRDALRHRAPEGSRFEPPWSTINVGRIAGGLAHNVIAEQAEIDWEMRPVTAGDAHFVLEHIDRFAREVLLPEMQSVEPDALIERLTLGEVAGLRPMAENAARDLVFRLTGQNAAGLVPFGTEAGLFQELGADVVVCGPGSIAQAHTPDEFIERAQLAQCAEMLGRLAATLQAP
jgi:acetylornithine deacetylase